jgi:hypothetical protein
MWFEPTALEQSTSELVALHKAKRFAGESVFDVCCGIGGDTIALARESVVVAVDRDPGMISRMRWNAAVYGVESRVHGLATEIETEAIANQCLVHVDPDRRASGDGRAHKIADYSPNLAWLRSMMASHDGGAIKLGPASDVFEVFGKAPVEIEVVSLHGECKEATVWFGGLATCERRATVLPIGATWTGLADPVATARVDKLHVHLFEPDAALVRAGLIDSFALTFGLKRFSASLDLLTSPRSVTTPFLTPFVVLADLPLDNRILRSEFRSHQWQPVEIKSRGLKPNAVEALVRGTQNLDGEPVTLFLLNPIDKARAIVAKRPQS